MINLKRVAVMAVGVALVVILGLTQVPAVGSPSTVFINIQNFAFSPNVITIPIGTTVVWVNNDIRDHTVTSTDGLFDSGILTPGTSFELTFSSPGTYNYFCSFHPFMVARVVVQAPVLQGSAVSLAIERALDVNHTGRIDDRAITFAMQYWTTGQVVPGTPGLTISDSEITRLVALWTTDAFYASF
jgi:plastocyanin